MDQDREHLRLLSLFHYVVAGLAALFSFFPMIHLIVGIAMVTHRIPEKRQDAETLAWMGWFFIFFAAGFMVVGFAFAACLAFAGHFLIQRRRYQFCLVMGGVACAFVPFGTVLGVFTILVLTRESVRALFHGKPSPVRVASAP